MISVRSFEIDPLDETGQEQKKCENLAIKTGPVSFMKVIKNVTNELLSYIFFFYFSVFFFFFRDYARSLNMLVW